MRSSEPVRWRRSSSGPEAAREVRRGLRSRPVADLGGVQRHAHRYGRVAGQGRLPGHVHERRDGLVLRARRRARLPAAGTRQAGTASRPPGVVARLHQRRIGRRALPQLPCARGFSEYCVRGRGGDDLDPAAFDATRRRGEAQRPSALPTRASGSTGATRARDRSRQRAELTLVQLRAPSRISSGPVPTSARRGRRLVLHPRRRGRVPRRRRDGPGGGGEFVAAPTGVDPHLRRDATPPATDS